MADSTKPAALSGALICREKALSYATAWAALHGNLGLEAGQSVVIRGATSALGVRR